MKERYKFIGEAGLTGLAKGLPITYRVLTGNAVLPAPFDSDFTEKMSFDIPFYFFGLRVTKRILNRFPYIEDRFRNLPEELKSAISVYTQVGVWNGARALVSTFYNPIGKWGHKLLETATKTIPVFGQQVNAYSFELATASTALGAALLVDFYLNKRRENKRNCSEERTVAETSLPQHLRGNFRNERVENRAELHVAKVSLLLQKSALFLTSATKLFPP